VSPRTARQVALGLACALALALQARFVGEQLGPDRQSRKDGAEPWLAELARLPPIPEAATVGFVTTIDREQLEGRLFLTRYALAPRTVLRGTGARLVIGHFRSTTEGEDVARTEGLSILAASGGGLFLMWSPTR